MPEAEPDLQSVEGEERAKTPSVDRLLSIPMPLSVVIAKREMTMGDVLNLTTGSVVEFDKHHKDLFDLMVGGKSIARGEAVIAHEKFGLRILEIGSAKETLTKVSGQIRS